MSVKLAPSFLAADFARLGDQVTGARDEPHAFGRPRVLRCNRRSRVQELRDEKVKVLKAIPSLTPDDIVRGRFRGYRSEKGVAPGPTVETFVALRLQIDSWRWQGVAVYIRAGENLPVTCTEVDVRFRQPPTMFHGFGDAGN